jgi:hypothetical protein
MSLIVANSLRLAALGFGPGPGDIEGRVQSVVDLFLNGARRRSTGQQSRTRGTLPD